MSARSIPITHVFTRPDARKIDDGIVRGLVESIRELGIINPLRVRPARRHVEGVEADAFEVTAGAHRLRAARVIGLDTVPCIVADDDDLRAELAMIDENLCRAELSAAQRAEQTARRKAIYEELHPETRNGAAGNGREKVRQVGEATPADRFTAETATRTGRSERAVQRDAERGEKVCAEAMALVAGTRLDTGSYLDRLKGITDAAEQVATVKRDLAAAPARKPVPPSDRPRNDFELINKHHRALVSAWEKARPEARERFLEEIGATLETAPVMDRRYAEA